MYGTETAAGGATLAATGLAINTGSMAVAAAALICLMGGVAALLIRRYRLKGQRP